PRLLRVLGLSAQSRPVSTGLTAFTSRRLRQPESSPCASSVRGSSFANFLQMEETVLAWTPSFSASCRTVRPAERSAKMACWVLISVHLYGLMYFTGLPTGLSDSWLFIASPP